MPPKQRRAAPQHSNFTSVKLSLLLLVLLAAVGFLAARTKSPTGKVVDEDFDLPPDLVYSECDFDGDLEECLKQITQDVAEITPLNLPESGMVLVEDYYKESVCASMEKETNPDKLGGENAMKRLSMIGEQVGKRSKENIEKLKVEMKKNGMDEESKAGKFLIKLSFLVESSQIPNCWGMSIQVAGRLLLQNIMQPDNRISSTILETTSKCGIHHNVNVKDANKDLIADPWNNRKPPDKAGVVCNLKKTVQNEVCAVYKSGLWNSKEYVSHRHVPFEWPNLSQESLKTRKFFRHRAMGMLKELNRHKAVAQNYSQEFRKDPPAKQQSNSKRFFPK